MQAAIGYLRVSTREQGRKGVGLAAQRHEIQRFASQEGLEVRSWYQDIQTGGGADALLLRPGLAQALKEAKSGHRPLLVSKLDRLSRNVHFISGLMEHRVHFMGGPQARGARASGDGSVALRRRQRATVLPIGRRTRCAPWFPHPRLDRVARYPRGLSPGGGPRHSARRRCHAPGRRASLHRSAARPARAVTCDPSDLAR